MNNKPIDIEYLVNEIENIISEHSPTEAMYNDVFQDMEIDIPLQSCTEQWKNLLQEYQMDYDDFICNILMAVLSDICADVSPKENNLYDISTRRKVDLRQKNIMNTKEKNYGDAIYKQYPSLKAKNLSELFCIELTLLLHGNISSKEDEGKSINPLLRLTCSKNINLEHFSKEDLINIIEYYKCICDYITDSYNEIGLFNQMLIIYHLEIETRFSTIFKIIEKLSCSNLNNIQKNILYQIRDICNSNIINLVVDTKVCRYQNKIYFGKDYYIEKSGKYCGIGDYTALEKTRHLLRVMYKIVKCIYVIRDTVMDRLKRVHADNYNDYIDSTYKTMKTKFSMNEGVLSAYERRLLHETKKVIEEYNDIESDKIKVDHFVRMYVSDDKFDNFQISEHKKIMDKKRNKSH